MNNSMTAGLLRLASSVIISLVFLVSASPEARAQNATPRTPSDTVREFYRTMHERRIREAFALSIYKPAIEGLTDAEFEELRPDFEKLAAAIPEKIEISGEQISGDVATVFVKIAGADKAALSEPVGLLLDRGTWIVGDKENQEIVRKAGRAFFFEARIQTHHNEVVAMLQRISLAQMAYASQHKNTYADLPALIASGVIPKDIESPDTIGYRFHVKVAKDGKSWTAGAEPVKYGRTGRLSYFMDMTGIRSADIAGKPLILPAEKK